jgi:predicted O-linked N-acetylglucosamine transferase (SPINDLY family)
LKIQLKNKTTKKTLTGGEDLQQQLSRAIADHQIGKYGAAIKTYKLALQQQPDHPHLHYLLGTAYIQQKDFVKAEQPMERAVELAPDNVGYINNLATVYMATALYDQAEPLFRKALAIDPDSYEAMANMGVVLAELGRWSEAMPFLIRIRLERPDMRRILKYLGVAYCIEKDWPNAIDILEDHLTTEPDDVYARSNLASVYQAVNDRDAMLDTLKNLADDYPDNMGYLWGYYHHLTVANKMQEAYDLLQARLEKDSMNIDLHSMMSRHHSKNMGMDQAYIHARIVRMLPGFSPFKQLDPISVFCRVLDFDGMNDLGISLEDAVTDESIAPATVNVSFLSLMPWAKDEAGCEAMFALHRRWGDHQVTLSAAEAGGDSVPEIPKRTGNQKKLRIGLLSSDIRGHVVSKFIQGFVKEYDRERFELYLYIHTQDIPDPIQLEMISQATGYQHVYNYTNVDLAKKIIGDHIDILFDLNAHTGESRLGAMVRRCAPIQITWLGYLFTTGVPNIDYILVDQWLCPPDGRWLVEKPLVKKGSFISIEGFPPVEIAAELPCERNKGVISFGSMNNPYKLSREIITLWSEVLKAVPNSRFIYARPSNEMNGQFLRYNLVQEFERNGITGDRLVCMENISNRHLPLYNEIDICLDTFPVTGGTTTAESLWMGVPVIIRFGPALHHRIGYSIVMAVGGMDDLCADNDADYIAAAARLANDTNRLRHLRQNLRQQMQESPLGDTHQFVQDFQDALVGVAREHGILPAETPPVSI